MGGTTDRPVSGRVAGSSAAAAPWATCDVCGAMTFEARCKIICRRCGYTRDCSDP